MLFLFQPCLITFNDISRYLVFAGDYLRLKCAVGELLLLLLAFQLLPLALLGLQLLGVVFVQLIVPLAGAASWRRLVLLWVKLVLHQSLRLFGDGDLGFNQFNVP